MDTARDKKYSITYDKNRKQEVKTLVSSVAFSSSEPLTSAWQWQSFEGLPYLTCSLLQDCPHGFFTQQFYPQTPEELVKVLDPDAVGYRVRQVHENLVVTPTEIAQGVTDADAIISEKAHQGVFVASADCNPVLIADSHTQRVAAIHAGWRGVAKNIVPEAITRFLTFGSSPQHLLVAIGPSINGEVYQVSQEVAALVGSSIIPETQQTSQEKILARLWQLDNCPLLSDPEPEKVRLDLRKVLLQQLMLSGLSPQQVAIAPYCTYQQPEYFFSYRRTQEKKVQWSGIVSN